MHRTGSFIHVECVFCPATAHYGLLCIVKHVKSSSSGDAGLLLADPEANSIHGFKENERMTG